MTDALPETPHFGLTRVGAGESASKNGYSALDLDRLLLDQLLYAAFNHHHDGIPALGDPTYQPGLDANAASGNLPASTTYYYRVSFLDQYGLETAASPEGAVATPDPISPPEVPAVTALSTGGTINPGVYSYVVTYTDAYGGETTPSPVGTVQVVAGNTNRIRVDLPDIPQVQDPVTGELADIASGFSIYRSRPGQSDFYLMGTATGGSYYDSGDAEDQTITAPSRNTTNSANSVTVTIPGPPDSPFIPLGCTGWRIYRATATGAYDGNSLVHEVTEGLTNTSTTPVLSYVDHGDALLQGFPKNTTSVAPMSPVLDGLTVNVPRGAQVLTAFAAGTISNNQRITTTNAPHVVSPVRLTAAFQTPPSGTVTFRVGDSAGNYVDLVCDSTTHGGSDPSGYYHREFPLILNGLQEAEDGTFSRSDLAVLDDVAATSGQSVSLSAINDQIAVDFGVLDSGMYHISATVRVVDYDTSLTDDLVIEVYDVTSATVLASSAITLDDDTNFGYQLTPDLSFTASGAHDIQVRVRKATSSYQDYALDNVRYAADHADLVPGVVTITALGSSGANANIAVWF